MSLNKCLESQILTFFIHFCNHIRFYTDMIIAVFLDCACKINEYKVSKQVKKFNGNNFCLPLNKKVMIYDVDNFGASCPKV